MPAVPAAWREPAHHPAYARIVCAFVRSRGGDVDAVLEVAGLKWDQLLREGRYLDHSRMAALVDAAKAATGEVALGLEVSRLVQVLAHGELSAVIAASSDLRQALTAIARFTALRTHALALSLQVEGPSARLRFGERFDQGSARSTSLELTAANIAKLVDASFGTSVRPPRLELPYGPTMWAERYAEFFKAGVDFCRPHCALVFASADLDQRSLTGDPTTFASAHAACERALTLQQQGEADLVARVRTALQEAKGALPTQAELASRLAMSSRTLVRRLARAGSSFLALRDEHRREQALWLLENGELPVAAIAERLGYVDASNFSASFRRWAGITPSEWRRRARAAAQ
ncbi:AraC family transcriptional regulator [Pelomonas sp. SE-A7]|uniref:AraC family transcriptional regulator n=1 Tax=Pelomonas sp. SE-A7 TaxID=3054953 RepID=UPI00259C69FF|nr:AraC family transcriptional regulator [Pelomonas sp. SE-A7]MDM4768346.1 AraC family transcriptional regulator ligand-binding domain-containing protein [Pelomonas sp. SE-A7]